MKTSKLIIAAILALVLVFALCGCGEKKPASSSVKTDAPAETQAAATEAPATEAPDYTGDYTAFAYTADELGLGDVLITSEAMEGTMTFTLNDGGKGMATFNDDETEITWEMDGENLTLITKDGNEISGTIKDGVMNIVMESDGVTGHIYLAKPDADTSSYTVLSVDEAVALKVAQMATE